MTEGLGWRNCNWTRYGLEETRKRERSRRKRRQPDESFINSSPAVDCIHRILIFAFTNCRALGLTFVPHSGAASFSFLSSAFVLFMDLFTLPSILICRAFFLTLQSIFFLFAMLLLLKQMKHKASWRVLTQVEVKANCNLHRSAWFTKLLIKSFLETTDCLQKLLQFVFSTASTREERKCLSDKL